MKPSATHNPDAANRVTNTIAFKRRMLDAAGGALTAEQVRALLGHKTIQTVYQAAKDRRSLMVEDRETKLFPAFQFDGNAIHLQEAVMKKLPEMAVAFRAA